MVYFQLLLLFLFLAAFITQIHGLTWTSCFLLPQNHPWTLICSTLAPGNDLHYSLLYYIILYFFYYYSLTLLNIIISTPAT